MTVRRTKEFWYSIRVVEAGTHEEAIEKVIENDFEESHPYCDVVVPESEVKVGDVPRRTIVLNCLEGGTNIRK